MQRAKARDPKNLLAGVEAEIRAEVIKLVPNDNIKAEQVTSLLKQYLIDRLKEHIAMLAGQSPVKVLVKKFEELKAEIDKVAQGKSLAGFPKKLMKRLKDARKALANPSLSNEDKAAVYKKYEELILVPIIARLKATGFENQTKEILSKNGLI